MGVDPLMSRSLLRDFLFKGLLIGGRFAIENGLDASFSEANAGRVVWMGARRSPLWRDGRLAIIG